MNAMRQKEAASHRESIINEVICDNLKTNTSAPLDILLLTAEPLAHSIVL